MSNYPAPVYQSPAPRAADNGYPFAGVGNQDYSMNHLYVPTHHAGPSMSESIDMNASSTTLQSGPPSYKPYAGPNMGGSRTPSPTPQEYAALNGLPEPRTRRQQITRYAIIAVVVTVVIVISVEHDKIIDWLQPETDWLGSHAAGPFIAIALLILVSFPPLFGHEIIAMLAGIAWSLPAAFAIVAVGTLLGEVANFFVFRTFLTKRAKKMEESNLDYALLSHVVRQGGFFIVLVIRYSAIPPHFSTVVFSTAGVSFMIFVAAAVLSLPRAFVPVYVGYSFNHESTTSKNVNTIVLVITVITTIVALRIIRGRQEAAKPEVIYARRKARQAALLQNAGV